jgi:hypothetical protein
MVYVWKDCEKSRSCQHFRFLENVDIPETGENSGENDSTSDVIGSAHINVRFDVSESLFPTFPEILTQYQTPDGT